MRTSKDEFGSYLAGLRKARGWNGERLALAIGRGGTFVAAIETRPIGVKPHTVRAIVNALGLTDAEGNHLLQLAARRVAKRGTEIHYPPLTDPRVNVLSALLSVPHEWIGRPKDNASPVHARPLLETLMWVLATRVMTARPLPAFGGVAWPDDLARLRITGLGAEEKIARIRGFRGEPIPIPDILLREELPGLSAIKAPLTPDQVRFIAGGMAHIYIRMLFGEPARACEAVQRSILTWRYDGPNDEQRTIDFLEPGPNGPQVVDIFSGVSPDVLALTHERLVMTHVYLGDNTRHHNKHAFPLVFLPRPEDWLAWQTVGLVRPADLHRADMRQRVRDARCLLLVGYSLEVLTALAGEFHIQPQTDRVLEEHLATAFEPGGTGLPEPARLRILTDPWCLGAVDPQAVLTYVNGLELLAREIEAAEGIARPALPSPTPPPLGVKKRKPRQARATQPAPVGPMSEKIPGTSTPLHHHPPERGGTGGCRCAVPPTTPDADSRWAGGTACASRPPAGCALRGGRPRPQV